MRTTRGGGIAGLLLILVRSVVIARRESVSRKTIKQASKREHARWSLTEANKSVLLALASSGFERSKRPKGSCYRSSYDVSTSSLLCTRTDDKAIQFCEEEPLEQGPSSFAWFLTQATPQYRLAIES